MAVSLSVRIFCLSLSITSVAKCCPNDSGGSTDDIGTGWIINIVVSNLIFFHDCAFIDKLNQFLFGLRLENVSWSGDLQRLKSLVTVSLFS